MRMSTSEQAATDRKLVSATRAVTQMTCDDEWRAFSG